MTALYCFRGWQLLLWAALLVRPVFEAAAQQPAPDTTRLRYSEEIATPPPANAPLQVPKEQRSLWKLGLNNFMAYHHVFEEGTRYTRYGLHVAYEHKLHDPAWSVLGEVSPALGSYRPNATAESQRRLDLRLQATGRYYYNLERRLLQGKNVSNFSANYLALAVGAGVGKGARETPYFLYRNDEQRFVTTDVALLYGLQRRLGHRGFVDANMGVAMLLVDKPKVGISGSVRIGLALGPQPVSYSKPRSKASEVATLRPRFYAGAEIGGNFYRVRYSKKTPYPTTVIKTTPTETQTTTYPTTYRDGYGVYAQYVSAGPIPYMYAGYYVAPRWAVQLGFQYGETFNDEPVGTVFATPSDTISVPNQRVKERGFALPVLVRYSLTPDFLRRLQFDALGGIIPVWSSVTFREYAIVNRQVTSQETFGFRRQAFGVHAALGLDASYAFGRRRRVQAVTEIMLNKDLRTGFRTSQEDLQPNSPYLQSGSFLAGGFTFGLRYRFGYR
ncbi:hypothetical protein MUN82_17020 [Hymenobacter aerilatus]|uniref:Outer membrane protein beta-barrel domain-containing protein n=1 Tax=Hymenobacter aerilatus TaxID=2932251 RepID=A0A8T9SR63_9BACT|nr:hypothetical protein [Hymenobacter aerilatus]UOR04638.1 hypothetical protein MUN82_17020 [Hymenobacter aerilatus]